MKPNTAPPRAATGMLRADLLGRAWSRLGSGLGRTATILLPITLVIACGSDAEPPKPAATPEPRNLTPTIAGPFTVRGEVFTFETGMVANASINLWVQLQGSGYSWWWANGGPLESDEIGLFEAANVPASQITILAFKPGFVQPCAVRSDVRDDLAIRVEMIPVGTLDAFNPPRPQLSVEPSLTGVIFETTATGRQPVAGASLWVEDGFETSLATTLSDRGGGFFLCNLGPNAVLHVSKEGFDAQWIGIDASESRVLEIELQRL